MWAIHVWCCILDRLGGVSSVSASYEVPYQISGLCRSTGTAYLTVLAPPVPATFRSTVLTLTSPTQCKPI
jgi:hypothetical protein